MILTLLFLCLSIVVAIPVQSYNSTNSTSSPADEWLSPDYYPSPQGGRIASEWQEAYAKAKALVQQMTIAEKVNLTTGAGWEMGPCVGNTGSVPRLGIPQLCLQDGPLGVRFADFVTGFPSGMAAGTTFNKNLINKRGKALGSQFKAKGVHIALGPVVGPLGLKAASGRTFESFGSDPYLQGVGAAETIQGLQSEKVMACIKHLVGNEQEHYRQANQADAETGTVNKVAISANIPDRAMHELYIRPFADAIKAGAGSLMCSYNTVNNTYACENSYLLNNLLKEELGFQGFVMSDWGAQHSGVLSAIAGLDMTMPGETESWDSGEAYWGQNLTVAVYNETVPLKRLDDMVTRILAAFYSIDAFPNKNDLPNFSSWSTKTNGPQYFLDADGPIVQINKHVDPTTQFTEDVGLAVAEEAIVLLKNVNQTLPITKEKYQKLLLSGIAAGPDPLGYEIGDQAGANGALFQGWGSGSVKPKYEVTPYEAIAWRARKNWMQFDYIRESYDLTQVTTIASDAHMTIVVVNADSGEGYITVDNNVGDRKNFTLWNNGDALIKAVTSVCSNVVVVINSPGPVDVEAWIDNANVTAALWAGPLGDQSGSAFAKVLFGEANPSGHLPFTFAKDVNDYVPIDTHNPDNGKPQDDSFSEIDLLLDYRYFDEKNITPRFEFGFGLSYNDYGFCNLQIKKSCSEVSNSLPEAPAYLPEYGYNDEHQLKTPSDSYFPSTIRKIKDYLYPYLNPGQTIVKGNYSYPDGYSTKQRSTPVSPGGGLGGNPALWEQAYEIQVDVTNEGNSVDSFVGQLYLEFPESCAISTPRQLRGFEKVTVAPHQKRTLTFSLLLRDLTVWDVIQQTWVVQSGTYKVHIGKSSRDFSVTGTFTV